MKEKLKNLLDEIEASFDNMSLHFNEIHNGQTLAKGQTEEDFKNDMRKLFRMKIAEAYQVASTRRGGVAEFKKEISKRFSSDEDSLKDLAISAAFQNEELKFASSIMDIE